MLGIGDSGNISKGLKTNFWELKLTLIISLDVSLLSDSNKAGKDEGDALDLRLDDLRVEGDATTVGNSANVGFLLRGDWRIEDNVLVFVLDS